MDLGGRIEHPIHVNTQNRISSRIARENAGGVVSHDEVPVLAPVGRIHHQRVLEAGVAHGDNRVLRRSNPVGRIVIPIRLVADVDYDVVLLSGQGTLNTLPITYSL